MNPNKCKVVKNLRILANEINQSEDYESRCSDSDLIHGAADQIEYQLRVLKAVYGMAVAMKASTIEEIIGRAIMEAEK